MNDMIEGSRLEYLTNRIMTADRMELVSILYETALHYVAAAVSSLQSGDVMARGRAVSKAQEALGELAASVDLAQSGELGQKLQAIYRYLTFQLLKAHASASAEIFEMVQRTLAGMAENWSATSVLWRQSAAAGGKTGLEQTHADHAGTGAATPYADFLREFSASRGWSA